MASRPFPRPALLGALLALSGFAPAPDTPATVISRPDGATFKAAWAAMGKTHDEHGRAVVRCRVSAEGAVADCALLGETPAGLGIGPLLLAVAPRFQVAPATHDGKAVASTIVLEFANFTWDKPADWLRKPTARDLLAVYPRAAFGRAKGGEARLSCLVSVQGALFDCYAQSESPPGLGFGAAAVALTPQFLMRPATLKGQPVISEVRVPIIFGGIGGAPPPEVRVSVLPPTLVWAAAPSYADVAAAYPQKARAARTGGRATLYCRFRDNGELTSCDTIAEEPAGQGFGAAARKLAQKFRAPITGPADVHALAGAAVQLPVVFDPAMLTPEGSVIGKPQWAASPGAGDVVAAFARTPRNVGTAHVMLSCTVLQGGWTRNCSVMSETPSGQGFGQAALGLSARFRLATWTSEGLPVVGGVINVPIGYDTAETAAARP